MFRRYNFSIFYHSLIPHTDDSQINIINILLRGEANPEPRIGSETTSRYASGEVDVPNGYCTDMNPVTESTDFRKNLHNRIKALNLNRTDVIVARIKYLISEYDLEISSSDRETLFGTYKNDIDFLVDAFKFSLRYKRGAKYKLTKDDIQLIYSSPKSASLPSSSDSTLSHSLEILRIELTNFKKTVENILAEPYNPNNSTSRELSPDGIKTYNKIAEKFNSLSSEHSMSIFAEDTTPNLVTHPRANEVLGQLDYALAIIGVVPNKPHIPDSYNRFLGIYYGYYRSASSTGAISGALIKIYKEDGQFKAIYITGLRDDKKMKNSDLKSIISNSSTSFEDYKNYTQTEEWKEQYSHFYEGNVEITDESILMHLKSPEKGTTKLTITTNLKAFKKDHEYMCGLALVLATSDGAFDTRIYRMGLINVKHGFLSLNTSGLPEQLLLSGSITQHLSVNADHRWCDFVRNHPCK